jgi:hypothetical protein
MGFALILLAAGHCRKHDRTSHLNEHNIELSRAAANTCT